MKWLLHQIDQFTADLIGLVVVFLSSFVVLYSVIVRQPVHFEVEFNPFSFSMYFEASRDE